MAEMLEQTREAIEGLKAAGFKRSEFTVRTPFDRSVGGYGRTRVSISASREKQIAAIPTLAENGFRVTRYFRADGFEYFPTVQVAYGDSGVDAIRFDEKGKVA